jgi:hypothetical protein
MATYRLILQSGPTKGTAYPLEKMEVFIGRDLGNDIVINDPEVSRRHARVYLQGVNFVIEDQGSTNGTSVAGQRLMGPYTLKNGDMVTFGEHVNLLFEGQVDSEATMVAGPHFAPPIAQPVQPQPAPYIPPPPPVIQQPAPQYVPPPVPAQAPAYSGHVPMPPEEEEKKRKFPTWLIILLILIVLVICICGAVAWFMPETWWCSMLGWLLNLFTPGVCPA